jgi:hypothetical protein
VQTVPVLVDLLAEVGSFTAVSRWIVSAMFKPGALGETSSGSRTHVSAYMIEIVVWTNMNMMA